MRRLVRCAPFLAAVGGSCVILCVVMQLWNAHFGVPFAYAGDALPHGLAIRQVVDNGWYFSDSRLGAPVGQHFQDWPLPDVVILLVAKVLGVFSQNWAAVVNALYLLSFPAVTATSWWVMRRFELRPWTATVFSLLYTFLPYHQVRGEYHLFLSMYFTVPLGALLAYRVISGEALFVLREPGSPVLLRLLSARTVQTVVFVVIIGLTGVYYAAFTMVFLVVAGLVRLAVNRQWRPGVAAVGCVVIMGLTVVMATMPAITYHATHGPNPESVDREPFESEKYGLKLAQMLLPADGHRISSLADLRRDYMADFPVPSEGTSPALGIVGALGLAGLLGYAVFGLVSPPERITSFALRQRRLAVLVLAGLLVGTIGGFATLVSLFVSAEIRSWNRISVFIAFFVFVALGMLMDRILRNRRRVLQIGVVVAVGAVGLLDQTNSLWVPPYQEAQRLFLGDKAYFGEIERRMPDDAMIFDLPRMKFPEVPPTNNVQGYELLRPYMATNDLRWSFGGVKGRLESSWQDRLDFDDSKILLRQLTAAGFQGVFVNRDGYVDNAVSLERSLRTELDEQQPFVGNGGRYAFYDIRAYAESLRQSNQSQLEQERDKLLFPVYPIRSESFFEGEDDNGSVVRWANGTSADLNIANAASKAVQTTMTMRLKTATGASSTVTVLWPDGAREQVKVGAGAVWVQHTWTAAKGSSLIRFSTDAPRVDAAADPRALHFGLLDPQIVPPTGAGN